jgi:hypothetical protein
MTVSETWPIEIRRGEHTERMADKRLHHSCTTASYGELEAIGAIDLKLRLGLTDQVRRCGRRGLPITTVGLWRHICYRLLTLCVTRLPSWQEFLVNSVPVTSVVGLVEMVWKQLQQ